MAELNKVNYASNEILKSDDFIFGENTRITNLELALLNLLHSTEDIIVYGLNVQERSTPSMNVDITVGMGFNMQDNTVLHAGSQVGPIAIDNGDATERIDTLEIKVIETDYDQASRAFKDPATGEVSLQDHYTKKSYAIQAQIVKGTAGSGNAPNHTSGWTKLAEIHVAANESTAIYNADIKNVDAGKEGEANTAWTTETTSTVRVNTLTDFKNIFRLKHSETGDHNNDVIQEQHIDWGLSTNQVSAEDIPVRDTASNFTASDIENVLAEIISTYASTANGKGASKIGVHDSAGRFTATEVEAVLAEIAGAGRTTETVKANKDSIDTNTGNISTNATNLSNHESITDIHRKITISTSDPSGGVDGDVWFKYV